MFLFLWHFSFCNFVMGPDIETSQVYNLNCLAITFEGLTSESGHNPLHWLLFEYQNVLKPATQVYTLFFIPAIFYFVAYLSPYTRSFYTRRCYDDGKLPVVWQFCPSIRKAVKQFDYSFLSTSPCEAFPSRDIYFFSYFFCLGTFIHCGAVWWVSV